MAQVVDGFADTDQAARFDGEPAVMVQVFRVGDQNALEVAAAVHDYVEAENRRMPAGITLTTWADQSTILRSRLDTLLRNGRAGFVLVFIVLALFLRLSLAGWVALGIPVSFLGAIALMPTFDVTINLISLFAFIVVLGIVVDDAIVVGENVYSEFEAGKSGLAAAVDGALGVHVPVVFAVLTTVAAFTPLLAVGGSTGKVMGVIPVIVISTLCFSLLESLFVLPNHLSHLHHGEHHYSRLRRRWQRVRIGVAHGLDWMVDRLYRPALRFALSWRYAVVAVALALLLLTFGVVAGGWIQFVFFPAVEADNVVALLAMPQGTPAEETGAVLRRIERAADELRGEIEQESGQDVFLHVLTSIGDQPYRRQGRGPNAGMDDGGGGGHLGEVNIELMPAEERGIDSTEIADRWRRKVGAVAGAEELTFTSSLFSAGSPIDVQLSGADTGRLEQAAERLKGILAGYHGVRDIADSFRAGKEEVEIDVTPEGEAAGLSLADVARQTRQAFYGEEAQRIQRGRNEVKVMVRLPESGRRSLGDLESLRFRAPGGVEVPFTTAARAHLARGPASIERVDRRRVLAVTADVDATEANANEILADLQAGPLPRLLADYPGLRYSLEGEQQEQRDTVQGLLRGFVFALLAIYVLLAIPFRSYAQPLIVMSAIPFGLIGAVGGHVLMGLDLTILSMFGIVALTGVVVNDSLVMVDFINQRYREGVPLRTAIRGSGVARFRAIVLTSLTTFAGLAPLLTERSLQARFLIPMAVSLAFGVLFATFITLLLVPVGYFILEDVKAAGRRLLGLPARDVEDDEEDAPLARGNHRPHGVSLSCFSSRAAISSCDVRGREREPAPARRRCLRGRRLRLVGGVADLLEGDARRAGLRAAGQPHRVVVPAARRRARRRPARRGAAARCCGNRRALLTLLATTAADRRQLVHLHLGDGRRAACSSAASATTSTRWSTCCSASSSSASGCAVPRAGRWRSPPPAWRCSPGTTDGCRGWRWRWPPPSASTACCARRSQAGPEVGLAIETDPAGAAGCSPGCCYHGAAGARRRLSRRPAIGLQVLVAAAASSPSAPLVWFTHGARRLPLSTVGPAAVHLADRPVPARGAGLRRALLRRPPRRLRSASGAPWRSSPGTCGGRWRGGL